MEKKAVEKMIRIKNLHYTYPPPNVVTALTDINIEIGKGEFVAIIGPNGSGKTTLSKCISGLVKPTKGSIWLKGKDINDYKLNERSRLIGYIFQNPDHQLLKDTVYEDISFGLKNLGEAEEQIKSKAERVLKRLNLWEKRDVHPFRLGKGERQKVAVATILAMEPEILIIDEPNTGQDRRGALEIVKILTELNNEGVTILMITHVMHLVAEYVRRVVIVYNGRIFMDGSPREIFEYMDRLKTIGIRPPQITEFGIRLGLERVPMRVEEARESIMRMFNAKS